MVPDIETEVTITHDDPDLPASDSVDMSWRDGRRIVELGLLADQLSACKQCCMSLELRNCVGERICGLGSILHVLCANPSCFKRNSIVLGKRSTPDDQQTHMRTWDVNLKLAAGGLPTLTGLFFKDKKVHVINSHKLPPYQFHMRMCVPRYMARFIFD